MLKTLGVDGQGAAGRRRSPTRTSAQSVRNIAGVDVRCASGRLTARDVENTDRVVADPRGDREAAGRR